MFLVDVTSHSDGVRLDVSFVQVGPLVIDFNQFPKHKVVVLQDYQVSLRYQSLLLRGGQMTSLFFQTESGQRRFYFQ